MQRILIVEDEPAIRKGIKIWLESSGFKVLEAEDGKKAIEMVNQDSFDLVVLDVMLPFYDGYKVLEVIRNNEENDWIPVIMLTAKVEEEDIILGLDLGADDYMTKPFSNRELTARIKSILRKKFNVLDRDIIKSKLFKIDKQKYRLTNELNQVELTRKEMDLLKVLIHHENELLEKEYLLETVWGYLDSRDTRTLDIHISKLRKKLEKIKVYDVIQTKRGVGYRYIE